MQPIIEKISKATQSAVKCFEEEVQKNQSEIYNLKQANCRNGK